MTTTAKKTLATIVANFTLGAIGDRTEIRKRAAAEALELTDDLPDDSPEKMLAYALDYGADMAASREEVRKELEAERIQAAKVALQQATWALDGAILASKKTLFEVPHFDDQELLALAETVEGKAEQLARIARLEEGELS